MTINQQRRNVFDNAAVLYDSARPGYPQALFDDIVFYSKLGEDARIIEVGCGTGQATLPMAGRGYAIDCIELGAQLAAVARSKLAAYPKVLVIRADFETVILPAAGYDLLFSATAFHWIDPGIRFKRAYDLLQPRGALALFWNRPAQTEVSKHYLKGLHRVYKRVVPQLSNADQAPPCPHEVTTEYAEAIPASGLFADVAVKKHYQATAYSARSYINLLDTFSDHRLLDDSKRQQLFAEIEALINEEFAGNLVRETVALLYLATRR